MGNMNSKRLTHGAAVRAIREALGIKHGEFAIQCDITPGYLTNIEAGRKQPPPAVPLAIPKRPGLPLAAFTYSVEVAA